MKVINLKLNYNLASLLICLGGSTGVEDEANPLLMAVDIKESRAAGVEELTVVDDVTASLEDTYT